MLGVLTSCWPATKHVAISSDVNNLRHIINTKFYDDEEIDKHFDEAYSLIEKMSVVDKKDATIYFYIQLSSGEEILYGMIEAVKTV